MVMFLLAVLGYLTVASAVVQVIEVSLTAKPTFVDSRLDSVSLTCRVARSGAIYRTFDMSIEKDIYMDLWIGYAKIIKGDAKVRIYQSGVTGTGSIGIPGVAANLVINITSTAGAKGRFRCVVNGSRSDFTAIRGEAKVEVTDSQGQCSCTEQFDKVLNRISSLEETSKRIISLETRLADAEKKLFALSSVDSHDALLGMDGDLMLRSLVWPEGQCGLLMPDTGCPSQGFSFIDWRGDGFRQFHTESTSVFNLDDFSEDIHLKRPYKKKNLNNNFILLYFCVNPEDTNSAEGPAWPEGSYCIHKFLKCPDLFREGSIFFDEENINHESKFNDLLPSGVYSHDTELNFCCRRDGDPNTPMYLPTSRPFYLYRYGGKCQQVSGMNVINEYIVFDTENSPENQDKYTRTYHPDGQLNDVRVELCYYERNK
ncbi:hypothetical protein Btru_049369 [Bulinus truncatus]|nr:hypothetical protein Btru_049369 [Bulinus truncatus]